MAAVLNVFLSSLVVSRALTYTQLVNSNTIAVSSSTYADYVASRAVDGNTDQNASNCSHTDDKRSIKEAWLRIDLGRVYSVKSVKIWNRADRGSAEMNTIRLRGYSLRVSNDTTVPPPESSCYYYTDPDNVTLPTVVEEDCERTARYIWIYQSNKAYHDPCPLLAICEVQIFGCDLGLYGPDCNMTCSQHCENDSCDIRTGTCLYGCKQGYRGSYCNLVQLVNNKTRAVGSSTYADYVASRAVDGDTDQNVSRCFHSDVRVAITEAWLRIDLGGVHSVKSVKFWYRVDRGSPYYNTIRLRGYSLRVSNDTTVPPPESSCYTDPGNVTLPIVVEEDCERTARYIWIYQSNSQYYDPCPVLEVCEVQVFGCEFGSFGEDCSRKCDHCKNNATCGIDNGECDRHGCAINIYKPPLCKECKTGYYGADCSKTCNHCKNNASCGLQSEECDDLGCAYSGYQPPLCKGCILAMYGLQCEMNCSRYCAYDDCDRKTGTCLDGCKSGYIGNFCNQTCRVGRYGINCREICGHCYNNSNCNHGNGTCLEGCEAGYWNHDCKTPCSDGRYGENCQYTCSGHCVNGEACDKTNGSCRSCVHGYQGSKCDRDISQSPTSFKKRIGPEDLKMMKMMLENERIQKEILKLEAETEVLRVRKNVLLRLQGILSELSEVVVQLLNETKI